MEKKDIIDTVYDVYSLLSSIITIATQAVAINANKETAESGDLCYGIYSLAQQAKDKVGEIEDAIMITNRLLGEMATTFNKVSM